MPSKNGAQIKDDEWAMRAFSFNGTQLCTFLNGEQTCLFPKSGFNCDRVNSLYVAPMSRDDMYLSRISPIVQNSGVSLVFMEQACIVPRVMIVYVLTV